MDLFVKELRINAVSDDIIRHCAKLIEWMPISHRESIECINIETFLKACIFIYECSRSFGPNIVNSLEAHEPFFAKYYRFVISAYSHENVITSLQYKLLKTSNSLRNAVILDNAFKHINKLYPNSTEHLSEYDFKEIKYRKLDLLVNRIFQIPFSQIDAALNKLCCQIEFDILGLLFCSNLSGRSSAKYAILEHKLCQKLKSIDHNDYKYFLKSIIVCIAKKSDGLSLFHKCTENKYFWEALCVLFNNFLDSLQERCDSHQIIQNSDIFYLIKVTLDSKYSNFYNDKTGIQSNLIFAKILTQLNTLFN